MNGTISVKSQKGVGSTFSFVALTKRTNKIPPDGPNSLPAVLNLTTMKFVVVEEVVVLN
jgi:hypothetical protein